MDNYQLRYGQPFSQEIVQHLMRQLISGLKNIFEKKLVHGDIKLKSILIHFDTEKDKEELNMMKATIKFSRFKNSLKPQKILNQELMKVDDKLLDDIKKGKPQDIFDLGLVCFKMIFGNYGHDSVDYEQLINDIQEGKKNYPFTLSKEILLFLKNMLAKNLEQRLKIKKLSKHIFLTKDIKDFELINGQNNDQNEKNGEHLCIYCLARTCEIIISPCGHKCICNFCYGFLKGKDNFKLCPICRKPIISVVEKVFEV